MLQGAIGSLEQWSDLARELGARPPCDGELMGLLSRDSCELLIGPDCVAIFASSVAVHHFYAHLFADNSTRIILPRSWSTIASTRGQV